MPQQTDPDLVIDAQPTKDFFISMLTRDIDLKDALVDLVDNCVDGARKLRPDGNFEGLKVTIDVSGQSFEIADNCGGMTLDTARRYAFRFGRDDSARHASPRSIGQFGVGMKRTLFKLGGHFEISSSTTTESFLLDVHVDDWRHAPGWDFRLDDLSLTERDVTETGTTITVNDLFDDVSANFDDTEWINELERDIRLKHGHGIRNGLSVVLNGVAIKTGEINLLTSDNLRPGIVTYAVPADAQGSSASAGPDTSDSSDETQTAAPGLPALDRTVSVKLMAGVAEPEKDDAGWYVYCNGRLVLGPDKSGATTWGVSVPATVPRYHDQYRRFRGYAFFDSDDPGRLPWTTTKTGVDVDNGIWRAARARMILLTRPVITFLNDLDRQNDTFGSSDAAAAASPPEADGGDAATENAERVVRNADLRPVSMISDTASQFTSPPIDTSLFKDAPVRVSFLRDRGEVNAVRDFLGENAAGKKRTNSEVGTDVFDYFWRNEIEA